MPLPNTPHPITPQTTNSSSPPASFAKNLLSPYNMTRWLPAPPAGFPFLVNP